MEVKIPPCAAWRIVLYYAVSSRERDKPTVGARIKAGQNQKKETRK